eukprot:5198031-Heterocapsa_arctica.AAC.1
MVYRIWAAARNPEVRKWAKKQRTGRRLGREARSRSDGRGCITGIRRGGGISGRSLHGSRIPGLQQ